MSRRSKRRQRRSQTTAIQDKSKQPTSVVEDIIFPEWQKPLHERNDAWWDEYISNFIHAQPSFLKTKCKEFTTTCKVVLEAQHWRRHSDSWETFCLDYLKVSAAFVADICHAAVLVDENASVADALAVAETKRGRPTDVQTIKKAVVAKELKAQGRTQSDIAQELGISQQRVSKLLNSTTDTDNVSNLVVSQEQRASTNKVGIVTQRKLDKLAALGRLDLLEEIKSNNRSVDSAYRQAVGKPKAVSLPQDILKASDRLKQQDTKYWQAIFNNLILDCEDKEYLAELMELIVSSDKCDRSYLEKLVQLLNDKLEEEPLKQQQ